LAKAFNRFDAATAWGRIAAGMAVGALIFRERWATDCIAEILHQGLLNKQMLI
jgi:hypothetical protein